MDPSASVRAAREVNGAYPIVRALASRARAGQCFDCDAPGSRHHAYRRELAVDRVDARRDFDRERQQHLGPDGRRGARFQRR